MLPIRFFPDNTNINFVKLKNINYFISVALVLVSFVLLATKGLNLGVDFAGGVVVEASIEDPGFKVSDLRKHLEDSQIAEFTLSNSNNPNEITLTIGETKQDTQVELIDNIKAVVSSKYLKVNYNRVDFVGPKVGAELIMNGIIATIAGFIGIMIYIWSKFDLEYSIGAVLSLVHDAILTLGFYSLTGLEFDLTSIAVILTVIGYSVNDCVVIFDRIRDNFRIFFKLPQYEIINKSINETLSRTTLTVATTMLANLALVLFGAAVIKSFSIAMLFGIAVGTYSSIFIAAPILVDLKKKMARS
ncbi:MAG: protein translocase subunit SecF [Alphaproteobacteria bacterium]|nr:protein translocase subunit SecF [Alphaproteobacteria bacterium]OJV12175.1 MAG: protein-export membrane protein SecF [Alphaproteobacteria bacterium 33-17]